MGWPASALAGQLRLHSLHPTSLSGVAGSKDPSDGLTVREVDDRTGIEQPHGVTGAVPSCAGASDVGQIVNDGWRGDTVAGELGVQRFRIRVGEAREHTDADPA